MSGRYSKGLFSQAAETDGPAEDVPLPEPEAGDGRSAWGDGVLSPPVGESPPAGTFGAAPVGLAAPAFGARARLNWAVGPTAGWTEAADNTGGPPTTPSGAAGLVESCPVSARSTAGSRSGTAAVPVTTSATGAVRGGVCVSTSVTGPTGSSKGRISATGLTASVTGFTTSATGLTTSATGVTTASAVS